MVAQLTSRSRRMSAISCIAAPILSNAPLYPAKVFNNASVGALSGSSEGTSRVVDPFLLIIGRQSSTHSSQIKTPGPATSVLISVWAFPQKEQRYSRLGARVVFASGIGLSLRQRQVDSQPCVDVHVNPILTDLSRGCFKERDAAELWREVRIGPIASGQACGPHVRKTPHRVDPAGGARSTRRAKLPWSQSSAPI
jgi:hypothetical protein